VSYHGQMFELMRQRERLLARCDAQRAEIAALVPQWEGPLRIADRVVAVINYLRHHPATLGVLVAALAIVQRRGWWGWAQRGFVLWRTYRAFRNSRSKLTV
jgi:hypothetical protein